MPPTAFLASRGAGRGLVVLTAGSVRYFYRRYPADRVGSSGSTGAVEARIGEFITSLDPSFRAQELSFAVSQVAANVDLLAAAERRGRLERLLGRQPTGLAGTLSTAQERAGAHVERHSPGRVHVDAADPVQHPAARGMANRVGADRGHRARLRGQPCRWAAVLAAWRAAAALGTALAQAYADSVRYLASAVEFGMGRCDRGTPSRPAPTSEAIHAAAASRRLDDTFRGYLAEQGAKPIPLAEVTVDR
jgi:hypothetical protein